MSKRVNVVIAIAFIASFLSSCGLEMTNEYLNYPPQWVSSSQQNAANFYPPAVFEPSFFGVEFFYKLYNSKEDADLDKSSFETRQAAEILPGTTVDSFLSSTSGLKYYKLCYNSSPESVSPLNVPESQITPTSLCSIEVVNGDLFFRNSTAAPTLLYRNIPGVKKFTDIPVNADADVKINATSSAAQYYIQIYAVSFGFVSNSLTFNSLSSKATFIGRLEL